MDPATTISRAAELPGPAWLVERRRAAAERFAASELPSAEEEVWRYSRIGDLDLDRYRPAGPDGAGAEPSGAGRDLLDQAGDDAVRIVTRSGLLAAVDQGPAGSVRVLSGHDLDGPGPLGTALGEVHDALGHLHDAFASPIVVQVPDGADAGRIVVVHESGPDGVASFPHVVVEVGQAASAVVVEIHCGADGVASLSLPVTELLVGRDARLEHATIQLLGAAAWQVGRLASRVEQGGNLHAGAVALGGDYARLRVDTALAGRGAHGEITAAYFGDRTQLLDFRTFQDHRAPDTTSNLLFKGALGEKGASVYTGLIKIRPEARGTQAFQTNRNLKLSDDTWAESVPNLEIENNEVQCSHASTVGPVDPEQRFYLESRGVPTGRAERLIVRGFFDEVVDGLPLGPYEPVVRRAIEAKLERSLP
jgi:Fe-S cluster assembly protein SufD